MTAQKLQIIQTVDENPNMKRIDIARMMKIPSSRLNTVRRYVCSFNVDENVINQLSKIDTRFCKSIDCPENLNLAAKIEKTAILKKKLPKRRRLQRYMRKWRPEQLEILIQLVNSQGYTDIESYAS
ncbi:hypothetical protein T08_13492 [Trichinella sp. T8]|nr:hypothetical protein T08_13492 [Trichinella sp. T8]